MKYIRTKENVYELVDYEQLDNKTKECLKQKRYVGLSDYANDTIFVKINKQMPKPLSQFQPIKLFEITNSADTIEELCDEFVVVSGNCERPIISALPFNELQLYAKGRTKYAIC